MNVKSLVRSLLPRAMCRTRIMSGPLRGMRIVTSWHDYPAAILGYTERKLTDWLLANARTGRDLARRRRQLRLHQPRHVPGRRRRRDGSTPSSRHSPRRRAWSARAGTNRFEQLSPMPLRPLGDRAADRVALRDRARDDRLADGLRRGGREAADHRRRARRDLGRDRRRPTRRSTASRSTCRAWRSAPCGGWSGRWRGTGPRSCWRSTATSPGTRCSPCSTAAAIIRSRRRSTRPSASSSTRRVTPTSSSCQFRRRSDQMMRMRRFA